MSSLKIALIAYGLGIALSATASAHEVRFGNGSPGVANLPSAATVDGSAVQAQPAQRSLGGRYGNGNHI